MKISIGDIIRIVQLIINLIKIIKDTMKARILGNWVTTVTAVIGALLMVLGVFFPDKIDPDTQEAIRSATGQILVGVGGLVAVLSGIFGKDK